MSTMADILRLNNPQCNNYGFEIELENVPRPPEVNGWVVTSDGSLRNNGVEYIFAQPETFDNSVERLTAFAAAMADLKRKPKHCARTSVHVHIDIRSMQPDQVSAMVVEWAAIEPLLFRMFGSGREYSPYCVPLHLGRDYTLHLLRLLASDHEYIRDCMGGYKYTALSCNRTRDLGTLEARVFNSSVDAEVLISYLRVCDMLASGCSAHAILDMLKAPEEYHMMGARIKELLSFELATPRLIEPIIRVADKRLADVYRRATARVQYRAKNERHMFDWSDIAVSISENQPPF